MSSFKDTFEANAFEANTFACGTWRGKGEFIIPSVPGIEIRVPDSRLHFAVPNDRLHFRVPDDRLHFIAEEE